MQIANHKEIPTMRKTKPLTPASDPAAQSTTEQSSTTPQIVAPASPPDVKTKPRAIFKPSADLANVIGSEPVTRPAALNKLWDYIRKNSLQSPDDKRNILPDAKLKPVLGDSKVSMFKFAGLIAKHLSR